jgi:hypothetical protein
MATARAASSAFELTTDWIVFGPSPTRNPPARVTFVDTGFFFALVSTKDETFVAGYRPSTTSPEPGP